MRKRISVNEYTLCLCVIVRCNGVTLLVVFLLQDLTEHLAECQHALCPRHQYGFVHYNAINDGWFANMYDIAGRNALLIVKKLDYASPLTSLFLTFLITLMPASYTYLCISIFMVKIKSYFYVSLRHNFY